MNDEIEVRHFDRVNNTPALRLATLGWLDGHERGLGENVANIFMNLKAFVAFAKNGRDTVAAGVMTYEHHQCHNNEIFIYQSYVLPEFRGRGLYTAMWNEIVAKGIELKAVKICSVTSVRNSAMRMIAARQGRVEEAITLSFNLETN